MFRRSLVYDLVPCTHLQLQCSVLMGSNAFHSSSRNTPSMSPKQYGKLNQLTQEWPLILQADLWEWWIESALGCPRQSHVLSIEGHRIQQSITDVVDCLTSVLNNWVISACNWSVWILGWCILLNRWNCLNLYIHLISLWINNIFFHRLYMFCEIYSSNDFISTTKSFQIE